MAKINWTTQAIEDIYELSEYYIVRSQKYADQLTNKIFEKVLILENFSKAGRIVPELNRKQIRELVFSNYRIIYRIVSNTQIDILAIHNGLRPLTEESIFE